MCKRLLRFIFYSFTMKYKLVYNLQPKKKTRQNICIVLRRMATNPNQNILRLSKYMAEMLNSFSNLKAKNFNKKTHVLKYILPEFLRRIVQFRGKWSLNSVSESYTNWRFLGYMLKIVKIILFTFQPILLCTKNH